MVLRMNIEKTEFILDYVEKNMCADCLDSIFVDAYIKKFNPLHRITMFGANKIPELSGILSKMYKSNMLDRVIIRNGNWQPGFPKWWYSYCKKKY
jgi:hypothetical protein